MASVLLVSRNEPSWGESKVYMRKHTAAATNNNSLKLNPNPSPNPNPSRYIPPYDPSADNHLRSTYGPTRRPVISNEPKEISHGGYVTYNLSAYTRQELKELKKRLISELEQVRILRSRIESNDFVSRLVYPPSLVPAIRLQPPHAIHVADPPLKGEKKKKGLGTKRSNPFNTGKDPNPKRPALEPSMTEKLVASMMRRCSQILTKLMKHKFGWVFNNPVDAVALGLHDYHQIIKHPMDLGTVKSRLECNVYQSPLDLAADVRLTFNNALTYNPKGSDVNHMAEQLLSQFEEMFNPAFKKFENERRKFLPEEPSKLQDSVVVVEEKAKKVPDPMPIDKKLEAEVPTHSMAARAGKLPKPKAKDPNKREMSFEEKAKLGMSLQELPPEKMNQVVQILRKRNGHLAQEGDEIELDIEAIDNETLWELDRFVGYYKKLVSKMRRQGLMQNQVSTGQQSTEPVGSDMAEVALRSKKGEVVGGEEDVDIGEEIPVGNYPPVEIEKDDANGGAGASSRSSSSSSSSSSGGSSSSSGSDSGSSSGSESDADSVQSPFVG